MDLGEAGVTQICHWFCANLTVAAALEDRLWTSGFVNDDIFSHNRQAKATQIVRVLRVAHNRAAS